MHTRIPCDSDYAALVGTAVYVFAYYEWAIIYLIQQYQVGFVSKYSRGAPMTSRVVCEKLESILAEGRTPYDTVAKEELQACRNESDCLVNKRNALIHAHPITDRDGLQILSYQARPNRPLPDMKWPVEAIQATVREFDAAACRANELLHRLLK